MATSLLSPNAKQQFLDDAGSPYAGALLYTYAANTTTPQATYTNRAGTVANANPIVLNARGEASIYLTPGVLYDYVLKTPQGATVWTQEDVSAQAGEADAVYFTQAGAGAVQRTVQDKERDRLSVKDFGAVGDGVTDDTAGVTAAVAAALAAGATLDWPDGSYLTTASIPSLHSVPHRGSGSIKRGGDTFYPQPTNAQVNRLYVATTGSDTNDGLSSAEPRATITSMMTALLNYGPFLYGDWRVILAAGTYAPGVFPTGLRSYNYIRLWGPAVGHPNVPTAIIDGAAAANVACLSGSDHLRMDVRDVKLQNGTGSLSIGLAATMFCDVYTNNVHTDNIYSGIQVTQNSRLRQTGGILTPGANGEIGSAVGVSSSMSIGYQAGGFGLGPRFVGAFGQAVKITENTTGHVDYCVIDGADTGLEITQNCRVNDVANDIKNCTVVAIRATQSCYANAGNVFTANAANFLHDAFSVHLPLSSDTQGSLRIGHYVGTITHTGTTAKTVLNTPVTIPANYFTDASKQIRIVIRGTFTSAGVISVGVDFGGGTIASLASSGATSGTMFEADITLYPTGTASQQSYERLIQATTLARHQNGSRTIDMTASRAVQIVGTLPNIADTLVIKAVEVWLTG